MGINWNINVRTLTEEHLWAHYEECLLAHDWTYNFSDDQYTRRTGRMQCAHIRSICERCTALNRARADKLFFKHSFWHNDDGSKKVFNR
jgi:hypothetical protein